MHLKWTIFLILLCNAVSIGDKKNVYFGLSIKLINIVCCNLTRSSSSEKKKRKQKKKQNKKKIYIYPCMYVILKQQYPASLERKTSTSGTHA